MLRGIRRFFGFESADDEDAADLFGHQEGPPRGPASASSAFRIGEKLSIKGEIEGEGDLELAGRFEGLIHVSGRVVVGDRAEVDADITATTIVVGGKVRGNLNATGRVEILPQGVLTGNLKSGSFAAADGALVKGEVVIDRGGRAGKVEAGGQP